MKQCSLTSAGPFTTRTRLVVLKGFGLNVSMVDTGYESWAAYNSQVRRVSRALDKLVPTQFSDT